MEKHRRFLEPKLVLGTSNPSKVRELSLLLNPFGIETIPASNLGLPEVEKTGESFQENSRIEALHYARESGLPALADVSGLCVNALGKAPGIQSAQWAGPEQDFAKARKRVLEELKGKEDRSAYFECALTLAWPDGHVEPFTGQIHGRIVEQGNGTNGFAYDPIFTPNGRSETFAEIGDNEKCIISHRAMALENLIKACLIEE